ncbi:MAG: hypothetical protein AAF628_18540 [Planctomycetota bacterium]
MSETASLSMTLLPSGGVPKASRRCWRSAQPGWVVRGLSEGPWSATPLVADPARKRSDGPPTKGNGFVRAPADGLNPTVFVAARYRRTEL